MKRRDFIRAAAEAAGIGLFAAGCSTPSVSPEPLFRISLAQWSFHRALRSGELDHLDFARVAMRDYGIDGIEYVNAFFKDRAEDREFLQEMKSRADGEGVRSLLIMCDGEGRLGDPDEAERTRAVENHYRWVAAAKFLGCHSIRVNAASEGTRDEQAALAADGLRRLTEFGETQEIHVIVENHGGPSSDGSWLADVMTRVDHPGCGTLPDFGNFRIEGDTWYDRYDGVSELMPFAKAVSAKSHDFDETGYESTTDYPRMLRIVLDAGYRGYIGIEYEGSGLSEPDGVLATRDLLVRVRRDLAPEYA